VIVKLASHVVKHGLAQRVIKELAQMTATTTVCATKPPENVVVDQDSLVKLVKLSCAQINAATTVFVLTACVYASMDGVG
jgi:hypothetical protein